MVPKYPRPRFDRVIEPFAGLAGYSLHHPERDVVLVERDPVIAELWRWLIRVTPAEVLALPDLEPGQSTDDLALEGGARALVGLWCNQGTPGGRKQKSSWATTMDCSRRLQRLTWDARVRHRIARQLPAIRHWAVIHGDMIGHQVPTVLTPGEPLQYVRGFGGAATWFVDPPFWGRAGSHYRFGSKLIDYDELSAWCQNLPGQAMVREQLGATWLPFERLGTVNGQRGKSTEVAWFSDERDRPGYRQPELFEVAR
jgi:hypothetical protein